MKRKTLSSLCLTAALIAACVTTSARAFTVFDPSNYDQNLIIATRALEQIDNQIRSLQNEAGMLRNMARNLQSLDHSSLSQITGALARIDQLMNQANGLSFNRDALETQWRRQYPSSYDNAVSSSALAGAARQRWQNAMDAFRQTMRLQSQIVGNMPKDQRLLSDLVNQSQGAVGHLQAQQAMNQLVALCARQQMQIQNLMAAQYRAVAEDAARKAQSEEAARAATRRFLGSATAWSGD